MSRKTLKGINIQKLISKATEAKNEGFYLETIFLCHSIIEERLRSTLLKIDKKLGGRNKIPGCSKKFKQNIKDKEYLFHLFFPKDLINEIYKWKKSKRDKLIHNLENNYDIINNESYLKEIAEEGIFLMKELNACVMRWKKRFKKKKEINK